MKPFFANLYQECTRNPLPERKRLLKLDGDGQSLKVVLGLGKLKSCDFLTSKNGVYRLIEVSDIKAQACDLKTQTSCINIDELKLSLKSTLTSRDYKKMVKKLDKCFGYEEVIVSELLDKYIQSLVILNALQKAKQLNERKNHFVVVFCQFDPADVIAFDFIAARLTENLKGLADKVQVIGLQYVQSKLTA